VRVVDQDDAELIVTYDPAIADPLPWVDVPIRVAVPAGTPLDPPVHVASSVDGWVHHPLAWSAEPFAAEGVLSVPRGEWFWFKVTRGDWATVEKWPACEEATNRYAFGAAHPGRDDTVWTWADLCTP
jgi:alpha-glucosidase